MKKLLLLFVLICTQVSIAQEQGFAQAEGVKIYYQEFGKQGLPVLIINGGPGMDSRGFETLAKFIAGTNCKAIIYDQRGTGRSQLHVIDSSTISMDKMVADIEALRKHLGFKEWVVLGHSFGGMLANYYASKHPAKVKALIASSSGGVDLLLLQDFDINRQLSPVQQDSLAYWTARIREGDTSSNARNKRHEFLAAAYLVKEEYIPLVAKRMQEGNMIINRLVWQDMNRINFDCKPGLRSYSKPVLIIQGEKDILNSQVALRAQETFSNSQLVVLPNCGHYGWFDQPEAYFAALENFLKNLEA